MRYFADPDAHRARATLLGEERDLCTRIQGEFVEMPGLTLTVAQAARLFSLESRRCERVLAVLVDTGYLRTNGRAFARADGGVPRN